MAYPRWPAVVAYGIMVKTMAVVAPLVLHLPAGRNRLVNTADTGVLGDYLRCDRGVHV